MKPNKMQLQTIQNYLNRNSVKWDGKIGYYSNGEISINVVCDFLNSDLKGETYTLLIDEKGEIF